MNTDGENLDGTSRYEVGWTKDSNGHMVPPIMDINTAESIKRKASDIDIEFDVAELNEDRKAKRKVTTNKTTTASLKILIEELTKRLDALEKENGELRLELSGKDAEVQNLTHQLKEFKDATESRLGDLEANDTKMKETQKESSNTQTTQSYADKLKSDSTHKLIQMVRKEQNESIKKENRVVVFGLTQSNSTNKEEDEKHNSNVVNQLLKDLKINTNKMNSFFRLKHKNDKSEETVKKSTPIIIEFINKEEKMNTLKQAKNLRSMDGYDGVYINNDLTQNEREILREQIKLRNELNTQDNTKDTKCKYYYGIRNFEVRKINKKDL